LYTLPHGALTASQKPYDVATRPPFSGYASVARQIWLM